MNQLSRGDAVPHVEVRTLEGTTFSYSELWQRRNLVLVALPEAGSGAEYISQLNTCREEFDDLESTCVMTREPVAGLPPPGVLVADRWGEIVYVVTAATVDGLPSCAEVLDWLQYVAHRCPECEGEAK